MPKAPRLKLSRKQPVQAPPSKQVVSDGLDLFSDPPVDGSLFGVEPKKIFPINTSLNPIEFEINSREKWVDLTRSFIFFFIGLTKTGAAIGNDAVGTVNNMAFSIFSHVEIKINGRQVTSPSPKSFAFVQWFRAFFHLSDDDKKSWGSLQGYLPIDTIADSVVLDNEGFVQRKMFTAADADGQGNAGYLGDQPFYMPLNQIPAFGSHKYIPPQVTINIRLYPFDSNWPLMSAGGLNYKANVTNHERPYLMVYHPMISPQYALQLEKRLSAATGSKARYALENIVMRDYNIPNNLSSHHLTDVVPPGPMPKRIIMMLQPQSNFEKPNTAAGRVLNPFKFALNNLTKVETNGDGGWDEIDLTKEPMEPYRRFIRMFETTGHGVRLTGKQFSAQYNMYIFDFTPAANPTDPVLYKLPRGTQGFTLHFNPVTANNTKAIFLLFYTSVLQLDMMGSVLFDDTVSA